jgi:DNA polymerase I-like protein with 3'-5' exonuclease and polymerase domains
LVIGEEAKEAISHDVQSNSHGHLKDAMLELRRQGIDEEAGLINQVHDDLQFDMPEDRVDDLIPQIKEIMEYPNPRLDGFSVRVEVKVGLNLADMEEVRT